MEELNTVSQNASDMKIKVGMDDSDTLNGSSLGIKIKEEIEYEYINDTNKEEGFVADGILPYNNEKREGICNDIKTKHKFQNASCPSTSTSEATLGVCDVDKEAKPTHDHATKKSMNYDVYVSSMEAEKMRVVWPKEAEGIMLKYIRDLPVIWDPCHPKYCKKNYRRQQLTMVAEIIMGQLPGLKLTPGDVRAKFNNFKNYYQKEKRKHIQKSGTGAVVTPKWEWYGSMSFLDSVLSTTQSTSNFSQVEPNSTSSIATEEDVTSDLSQLDSVLSTLIPTEKDGITLVVEEPESVTVDPDVDNVVPPVSSIQRSGAGDKLSNLSTSLKSREYSFSTPKNKRRRKPLKSHSDSTAATLETLEKPQSKEQDFAYGVGVIVVDRLRRMNVRQQNKFLVKVMALFDELST